MPPKFNFNHTCPVYNLGNAVPKSKVVYKGRIIPLDMYLGLGLNEDWEHTAARSPAPVKLPSYSGVDSENLQN